MFYVDLDDYYFDLRFDVKKILGFSEADTRHDEYIDTYIPLLVDYLIEECNNKFLNAEGVLEIKGGVKIVLAKMIQYSMNKVGVKNQTFGEVSYSYDLDFPPSILRLLEPYRRIRV